MSHGIAVVRFPTNFNFILVFVKGQMGPILASNPGMTRGEAMKEVGKLWRSRGNPTVADIDGVAEQLESLSMGA